MSNADEFAKWAEIYESADENTAPLAWRGLQAMVEKAEAEADAAEESANGGLPEALRSLGFWIALGAVLSAWIIKGALP
jgi:hypothetical protein